MKDLPWNPGVDLFDPMDGFHYIHRRRRFTHGLGFPGGLCN